MRETVTVISSCKQNCHLTHQFETAFLRVPEKSYRLLHICQQQGYDAFFFNSIWQPSTSQLLADSFLCPLPTREENLKKKVHVG